MKDTDELTSQMAWSKLPKANKNRKEKRVYITDSMVSRQKRQTRVQSQDALCLLS